MEVNALKNSTVLSSLQDHSDWLVALAAECLDLREEEIDRALPLARHGLDSVAAVQLLAAMGAKLGREVPPEVLLEYPDIYSLAGYMEAGGERLPKVRIDESLSERERMLADSVLPHDVQPGRYPPSQTTARAVLLTGATGFLGTYLLRALLRETSLRLYCLVRPGARADGMARLRQSMDTYGLWDASVTARIHPVEGNLLQPDLGMPASRLDTLCREVDAVYHVAAAVNWVLPYEGLRAANVLGTQRLLRLACRHKAKPFHFVSSLAVCYSTTQPARSFEHEDQFPHLAGIHLGYAQSKCVAEQLVRQAGARGLPVAIYRPSLISGDSRSGTANPDDFLSRAIQGCIRMGAAPDLDWPLDCCPVDHVADAIVILSRRPSCSCPIFPLANPETRDWRELVLWMNLFGFPMRLLPYQEWLSLMEAQSRSADHPLHPLRIFFLAKLRSAGGLTLAEIYQKAQRPRGRGERSRAICSQWPAPCPPLDAQYLDRCFRAMIQRGYLPIQKGARESFPSRLTPYSETTTTAAGPAIDAGELEQMLRIHFGNDQLLVRELSDLANASSRGILGELTSWRSGLSKREGLHRVVLDAGSAIPSSLEVFVKVKPRDEEVFAVGEQVAALCGPEVGRAFAKFRQFPGLVGCHVREIAVYQQVDDRLRRHVPALLGSVRDDERGRWILVLESLRGMNLLDSADNPQGWAQRSIEAAVRGIAEVHAVWYGREKTLVAQPWLGPTFSARGMADTQDLWASLADYSARWFGGWLGPEIRRLQRDLVNGVDQWWRPLEELPRTLIHNDFNPRNVALRESAAGPRLCAYDWELATLAVPQHDLAEFLCFVLCPGLSREEVIHYVDLHRQTLERASGQSIDPGCWLLGLRLSLWDLFLNRFPFYTLMHTFRHLQFLEHVLHTWRSLCQRLDCLDYQRLFEG